MILSSLPTSCGSGWERWAHPQLTRARLRKSTSVIREEAREWSSQTADNENFEELSRPLRPLAEVGVSSGKSFLAFSTNLLTLSGGGTTLPPFDVCAQAFP